jgi:hypothetical protein
MVNNYFNLQVILGIGGVGKTTLFTQIELFSDSFIDVSGKLYQIIENVVIFFQNLFPIMKEKKLKFSNFENLVNL